MSKKSCFIGPFDKERGKCAEALLKSASDHLYPTVWSLKIHLSCKKSLLLTCQILVLLVNTLAADERYLVPNRHNLTILIQMQLSQKSKNFSQFFSEFLKSRINLKYFEKKMTLIDFVFLNLRPPKTWSDKCLKSPVWENLFKINMVNVPKHCWVLKHLSYWHANLLTAF